MFYRQPSDEKPTYWEKLRDEKGCLAVEMESFALFHNARILGKRAACLLTISDSFVSPEITTAEQRQTSFTAMMKVALGVDAFWRSEHGKAEIQALIREAFAAHEVRLCTVLPLPRGAALRGKNGQVFRGCNIENASYTPTNCAERTALFKAVSEGVREFDAIAIVGSKVGETNTLVTGPCGVCRQALYESAAPN